MDKIRQIRKDRTGFGWWLLDNMDRRAWSCRDVAERLHTTRQNIRNHIISVTKPSYSQIIAYCWLFDFESDPNEIWSMIEGEAQ